MTSDRATTDEYAPVDKVPNYGLTDLYGMEAEAREKSALRERVERELTECYGTDDWPWLSDLFEVVVALVEREVALATPRSPKEADRG